MKTFFFISLFALVIFTSCKKEYNCVCSTNKNYSPYETNGAIYDFYYEETKTNRTIKDQKEDARASCSADSKTTYEPGPYAQNGQDSTTVIKSCGIY